MIRKIFLFFIMSVIVISCGPKRAVTRTASDITIDLSGRWNDTDSRLVSEEMIRDCVMQAWLSKFKSSHKNEPPTVIVGMVKNKSYEHIAVETFIKDLERALINSGEINFVASKREREELREERKDMAMHAREETQKAPGAEIGADFMLQGQINSILDESEGQQVRYYQVELELINLENNLKSWIGQKRIKKLIEKSEVKW
jgi:uncharacterized protein (TIGR02722 family)